MTHNNNNKKLLFGGGGWITMLFAQQNPFRIQQHRNHHHHHHHHQTTTAAAAATTTTTVKTTIRRKQFTTVKIWTIICITLFVAMSFYYDDKTNNYYYNVTLLSAKPGIADDDNSNTHDNNNNNNRLTSDNLTSLTPRLNSIGDIEYNKDLNNKNLISNNNLDNGRSDNNNSTTIAYAISIIMCNDDQSNVIGLIDAAIVLRHSIHINSIRNLKSGSQYDYKMYAIIHTNVTHCINSQLLIDIGYTLLIRDIPVQLDEIQDDYLRKHIPYDGCCGHYEFMKLYAYTIIDHPIVVHVDIDTIFNQPMDHLYNAILYNHNTEVGILARSKIPIEPSFDSNNQYRHQVWPEKIDCFMTRDWHKVKKPYQKAGYQGGLLIIRPNLTIYDMIINVIRTTPYIPEQKIRKTNYNTNGWGGKGYGSFFGSMGMQGLLAYVYDEILPNNWVEINQCRFNHMGVDVMSRKLFPTLFMKRRCNNNYLKSCEDCRTTNLSDIYNIHYTACRKPWNCIGQSASLFDKTGVKITKVKFDHCMELLSVWHSVRTDLENQLLALTGDETIHHGQSGTYKTNVFQGHCRSNGGDGYIQMSGNRETIKRVSELYDEL